MIITSVRIMPRKETSVETMPTVSIVLPIYGA